MTISEMKELIIWARSQKVKSLKLDGAEFELHDLAHLESITDLSQPEAKGPKDLSVPPSSPRLPDGNVQVTEDEELLFWSARQG